MNISDRDNQLFNKNNNECVDEIIHVNSLDRSNLENTTSCKFKVKLPQTIDNLLCGRLMTSVIPNLAINDDSPNLFLEVKQFRGSNVMVTNDLQGITDVIDVEYDSTNTAKFKTIISSDSSVNVITNDSKAKIQDIDIQIFNKYGELHSFGLDTIAITSFSVANPTVVTTSVNHGLVAGNRVYIKNFTNGKTISIDNTIMRKSGYPIGAPGANTFTLPIDLTAEVDPSYKTGITAFPLGQNAIITVLNGPRTLVYMAGSSWSLAIATVFTYPAGHGLLPNDEISIAGFDNGSAPIVNQQFNRRHNVIVINPNQFSIPVNTTLEGANQPLTGNTLSTLGSGSILLVEKYQVAFTFKITKSLRPEYNKLFRQ